MKRRKCLIFVFMMTILLSFAGCGSDTFPQLTEEEHEAVGEYAARLLLKYDANNRSRLVDFSEVEARDRKLEAKHKAELEKLQNAKKEESGMDPVEDTPTVDKSENVAPALPVAGSLEEFFGLPEGVLLVYGGCNVEQSIESDVFALEATAGKKLLLLKFSIYNQTEQDTEIDFLSQDARVKISVNNTNTVSPLRTMLMNDLFTYKDVIAAGGMKETFLVAEVSEDITSAIDTISLSLKNESKTYTISLQ